MWSFFISKNGTSSELDSDIENTPALFLVLLIITEITSKRSLYYN